MGCELVMLSRYWIGEAGKAMEYRNNLSAVSLRCFVTVVFFIMSMLAVPGVVMAAKNVLKEIKIQTEFE